MLLLFYLCFAATPDFNSHSVRRQSVTTVSCVIWWVTSLTDLGAELRLKGSLFHITPSPSEFKSKWLQASHLREKNGETGVICRPVAATGQLVGHCIGGKVSSRLHLQWPGTPGTPAATTALGAKSVASCTYSGQEHQKQQQLHVHPGQRNWAACTRSQLQETISIRLRWKRRLKSSRKFIPGVPGESIRRRKHIHKHMHQQHQQKAVGWSTTSTMASAKITYPGTV